MANEDFQIIYNGPLAEQLAKSETHNHQSQDNVGESQDFTNETIINDLCKLHEKEI
ncbi:1326_t:CDS:2 [Cetraspora pellucida]|uniref:1326_t:CDS:1 n=1 Tax=Cetraspora pellucida TaxID=1433469 RepID=A0A9N9F6B7_9GLOM|nr:1326_t:CDS:2 [Cetraspora pellucida]